MTHGGQRFGSLWLTLMTICCRKKKSEFFDLCCINPSAVKGLRWLESSCSCGNSATVVTLRRPPKACFPVLYGKQRPQCRLRTYPHSHAFFHTNSLYFLRSASRVLTVSLSMFQASSPSPLICSSNLAFSQKADSSLILVLCSISPRG